MAAKKVSKVAPKKRKEKFGESLKDITWDKTTHIGESLAILSISEPRGGGKMGRGLYEDHTRYQPY